MKKTLLLGWDGADWNIARPLMEAGQMPCLSALVAGGAAGNLTSFSPYLSPILWTTIATGHHPDRHGVHGFAEQDPATGEARAVGTSSRRTKALWTIFSEQGASVGVVGWMGSFPAEAVHGRFVADEFAHAPEDPALPWPVAPGCVYPPAWAEELMDLRLRPEDVDPGLLGLFLPAAREADGPRDWLLWQRLRQRLAQLYSIHNASIALVGRGQPDFLAVYFHFLDLICHEFVAFHPPRHPRAGVRDYERYKEVVSAAYRVQDALLGDLLSHCAPDTGVVLVSDHGFTTGAARPNAMPQSDAALAAWHRREGIFAARGPGVAHGRRTGLVRPHDIAPTLLTWQGLPRGEDMPGRVLAEMFAAPPEEKTIPSWENQSATRETPFPPAAEPEANEQTRLTERFVALGYLDPAVRNGREGGVRVAEENFEHLGMALRDLGRPMDALPWLQAAALADPESPTRAIELARGLLDVGLPDEAERAARPFFDHEGDAPRARLFRAQCLVERRRFKEARAMLKTLAETELADLAGALSRVLLLRAGRWEEARAAFLLQLGKTPERVLAHLGLAEACLNLGRLAEATEAVKRATALDPASTIAQSLRERIARGRADQGPPPPPGWAELAEAARKRIALRAELREREREFLSSLQNARIAQTRAAEQARGTILVVSGAPRSGTSMMMRMLAQAGVPVLTDGVRTADADNPLGYFEWEAAKRLAVEPELAAHAEGKAVKVISAGLDSLPPGWRYEVVFMRRSAAAILRSQERMLARTGHAPGRLDTAELERHVADALAKARARPEIRLMEMDYDALLDTPEPELARLVDFLGPKRFKRITALRTAIRGDLRHQTSSAVRAGAAET